MKSILTSCRRMNAISATTWTGLLLVLLLIIPGTVADPPPNPQCRVFCFRITDIRCDEAVENRYHFEFEVLNWSNALAGGVKIAMNRYTDAGLEFGEPFLGGVDPDGRPLIWEDIDGDGNLSGDPDDLEDANKNGKLDGNKRRGHKKGKNKNKNGKGKGKGKGQETKSERRQLQQSIRGSGTALIKGSSKHVSGEDHLAISTGTGTSGGRELTRKNEDLNNNNRLDNDPIPGNLGRANSWALESQTPTMMQWTFTGGDAIPFINLVDAADCRQCIESLPQRDGPELVSVNGGRGGNPVPLEYVDNGDNVQDGFVMTIDGFEPGKTVHLNWFLLGAGAEEQTPDDPTPTAPTVLITELMYNPTACWDMSGEWIELYNAGPAPIDITGWRVTDLHSGVTVASKVLGSGEYYILSRSGDGCGGTLGADQTNVWFYMNNGGQETITLWDASGNMIDRVIYSGSSAAAPGYTLKRKADANGRPIDTDDSSSVDFMQSARAGGTPRAGYSSPGSSFLPSSSVPAAEIKVLITELMYNPKACSDNRGEWIEIYNAGSGSVDITGWRISDKVFSVVVANKVLASGEYYILARSGDGCGGTLGADQTNVRFYMNNGGEERVTLRDSSGKVMDQVVYWGRSAAAAGYTLKRKADADGQPIDTDDTSSVDFEESAVPGGTPRSGYLPPPPPIDEVCRAGEANVPADEPIGTVGQGNAYGFGVISLTQLRKRQRNRRKRFPGRRFRGQTGFRQTAAEFFDSVYIVPGNSNAAPDHHPSRMLGQYGNNDKEEEGDCGEFAMEFTPGTSCGERGPVVDDSNDGNCIPIDPNGGGDPHFSTWSGEKFTFHGECDLVLIRNPAFVNGLGMHVHGRTKIHEGWSDMETVAIQIGPDILEARGAYEYWINGEPNAQLPALVGGYQVSLQQLHARKRRLAYVIHLGGEKEIHIRAFEEMMWVQIKGQQEAAEIFAGTEGLLGRYETGHLMARNGTTIINDPIEYGQEWQVRPDLDDPVLFRNPEGPQYPEKCKMPTVRNRRRNFINDDDKNKNNNNVNVNNGDDNNKSPMEDEGIRLAIAKKACAHAPVQQRDDCIYDVVATKIVEVAEAY